MLQRKPAQYGALLAALRKQLEALATRQLARALGDVVHEAHSDVFQQIRY